MDSGKILNFSITPSQFGAFKQTICILSRLTDECKFVFTQTVSGKEGGLSIIQLSADRSTMARVKIPASNFYTYNCTEPEMTICVCTNDLYKKLGLIENNATSIEFYVLASNKSSLQMDITSSDNIYLHMTTGLCEPDNDNPNPIPSTIFKQKITIDSKKFIHMCKNINKISKTLAITSDKANISFSANHYAGIIEYISNHTNNYQGSDTKISNTYEIANILKLERCDKIYPTLDIFMKKDFPLVITLPIATLGTLYYFVSPVDNTGQ